jgi:hypothetical protein
MRTSVAAAALLVVVGLPVGARSDVQVDDPAIHAGGHPAQGVVLSSTGHRVTLDALGEPWRATPLASAGYRVQGAFVASYPPPLEVGDVRFADGSTLGWAPERSVGSYRVYRGAIDELGSGGYGSCLQSGLVEESAVDVDTPVVGEGFVYLVAAVNRLEEQGSLGTDSAGTPRESAGPCP